MSKSIIRSVLLGGALATACLVVSAAQPSGPKTSPALYDTFTAAQTALDGKRYPEAAAKAREVLASPRKTPDDVYAANYLLVTIATAQRDTPGQIAAMEGMLDSGFAIDGPTQLKFRKALMSAYYQQKNFPLSIKHGTDMIKAGGADEDVYTVVGQSYYQSKNYGEAVKLFEGLVSNAEKAGRKPDRQQLGLLQGAYANAGNAQAAQVTLEKLVRHYPDPKTWLVLLYEVKKEKLDPRQKLHLYRLMESTGNLREGPDFMAYSEAATALGLSAEAHRSLDAGLSARAFKVQTDEDRAKRYLNSNATRAEVDRAGLPALQSEAKGAPTGNEFVALGMGQLSFQQYPQAIESLKAGLAKGGLRNAVDAQVTLGVAQVKAGQKGEAVRTFRGIQGADPVTDRIVKLWILHST